MVILEHFVSDSRLLDRLPKLKFIKVKRYKNTKNLF